MGIKDLNKLLKEECGDSYTRHVPPSEFAYKRLAVDAPLYLHKYVHTHDRRSIVDAYVEMICRMRENKIHPVFVFDGDAPPEKKAVQQKRAEERRRQEERVAALERDLRLDTPSPLLLDNYNKHVRTSVLVDADYDPREMASYVARLRSHIVNVDDSDYDLMKQTLDALGVPWIRAPQEAEMLCVQLCRQGLVAGVVSTDTDALAARCPVVVREMKNDHFLCVHFDDLIAKIRMTPEQFTDLCIMCGTDFNSNIPGIGWKKALRLIRQHVRIEDVPVAGKEVLNHVRGRQLFQHEPWTDPLPFNRPVRYAALEKWLVSKEAATSVDSVRRRIG